MKLYRAKMPTLTVEPFGPENPRYFEQEQESCKVIGYDDTSFLMMSLDAEPEVLLLTNTQTGAKSVTTREIFEKNYEEVPQ